MLLQVESRKQSTLPLMEKGSKMVTYAVTGGIGLVGSHVARALVARSNKVRMLDNFTSGNMKTINDFRGHVDLRMGDIMRREDVMWLTDDVDVLIHCAAQTDPMKAWTNPEDTSHSNINGTLSVLQACKDNKVQRVVYISCAGIYGSAGLLPMGEHEPFHPLNPLAISKLAAERYCMMWEEHGVFECVSLRVFEVYGAAVNGTINDNRIVPHIINSALTNKPVALPGGGKQVRDFVHASDVAEAVLAASDLDRKGLSGREINIGTNRSTSYESFAADVIKAAGSTSTIVKSDPRPGESDYLVADISLAEQLLSYSPAVSLSDGIEKTINMLRIMTS